ncbi:WhiB family transcriptional regulator [Mycobacterium sp.]|uniref:WhiB family transcriptional regulator n=1 Tax=Mycobacterium sp. TaxID=1785 RepID=UPI003A8760F7
MAPNTLQKPITTPPPTPACTHHNPELWFPEIGDPTGPAIAICTTCPIRETCLHDAITRNETHGIWGGAGQSRRRTLRRAWRQGPDEYTTATAAHFRALDDQRTATDRQILCSYGPDATHGRRVTYARACRCEPCTLAAAYYTAKSRT